MSIKKARAVVIGAGGSASRGQEITEMREDRVCGGKGECLAKQARQEKKYFIFAQRLHE